MTLKKREFTPESGSVDTYAMLSVDGDAFIRWASPCQDNVSVISYVCLVHAHSLVQ